MPGPGSNRPRGNRRLAVIFLVATLLILAVYNVNRQRIDEANRVQEREEIGRERLCEVREETGGDTSDC